MSRLELCRSACLKRQLTTYYVDVDFGSPFSWSPDGSKIIYTAYQSNDWSLKNGVLWMIDVNSKTEAQFTFNN
ncbi:MAG: PD40 domain-containing protein [Bacteroidota bacterium]|nr:PD40 domain-containing protein [Bacteroidota bacterium]